MFDDGHRLPLRRTRTSLLLDPAKKLSLGRRHFPLQLESKHPHAGSHRRKLSSRATKVRGSPAPQWDSGVCDTCEDGLVHSQRGGFDRGHSDVSWYLVPD